MKKYDTAVLIGRFQPFHNAHLRLIDLAFQQAENLIIIIGSARKPRTFDNPWSEVERGLFITGAIENSHLKNKLDLIQIAYNIDTLYDNNAWLTRVQNIVRKRTNPTDRIALVGHKKPGDQSTFYLDMFPQWDKIDIPQIEILNATNMRELYFQKNHNMNYLTSVVPSFVFDWMQEFKQKSEFEQIIRERQFIEAFKKQYEHLPYPLTFNTGDAVVTGAGHVLLIQRKSEPGRDLWALPGGYLNARTDHSVEDAALRELKEETNIKLQTELLRGRIKSEKRFDAINRSPRGRIITNAFHIPLDDTRELPKIKAGDDAKDAKWWARDDIKPEMMFEDHYEIIDYFVK